MSKLTLDQLVKARDAAEYLLKKTADGHTHPGDAQLMKEIWTGFNEDEAPPAIVKAMADELIELRRRWPSSDTRIMVEHHAPSSMLEHCSKTRAVVYQRKISADNLPKDIPVSVCEHEWIASEGRTASGWLCRKCGDYNGPQGRGKGARYTKTKPAYRP